MTQLATPPAEHRVDQPRVPIGLAVVIMVGAVVLGLVLVGAVVWVSKPRLSTGPEVAPPPGQGSAATVDYDAKTRIASVQEMRIELPLPPYECSSEAGAGPPLFTSIRTCDAVVHANYNSAKDDWTASFGIAVLAPSAVVPGDLPATGREVYQQLVGAFFSRQKTTVKKRATGPLDIAPPGKAQLVSGEVHYAVPGLSSTFDRMVVIVVELADGQHAVCFSVRPNDAPKPTLTALNRALNTLTTK